MKIIIIYIVIFILVLYCISLYIHLGKSKSEYRSKHYYKFYDLLNPIYLYKITIKLYRYINGLNKDTSYKIMDDVHEILNKYKIYFWLSEGTALGIFRNNDLIDYDDDVDFSFMGIYNGTFEKYCIPEFRNKGYLVGKLYNSYYIIKNGMFVDFDIIYKNDICLANNNNSTNEIIPYLQEFYKIIWRNKIWNIPKEEYFIYLYGKNYMIPLKHKKPDI